MNMTVIQAFDEFIKSRRRADLTIKTISNYQNFVAPFIAHIGANEPMNAITQENINQYIDMLLDKPISRSTRATYIRHVKVFLKWVAEDNKVNYSYEKIRVPRSPKKNVKIYESQELIEIFSHIRAENEWMTARNKCIIALMYDSGLRQSEVCYLERARVSFGEKRMVVYGKGNKERVVPLGKLTAQFMKEYLTLCPYETERLFVNRRGKELTANAVKLLVQKISNQLDFEMSSHKLRHNFATNYCIDQYEFRGNVDIYQLSTIMGHEDVETTKRYLHHAKEHIGVKNCISHLDMVYKKE